MKNRLIWISFDSPCFNVGQILSSMPKFLDYKFGYTFLLNDS